MKNQPNGLRDIRHTYRQELKANTNKKIHSYSYVRHRRPHHNSIKTKIKRKNRLSHKFYLRLKLRNNTNKRIRIEH